MNQIKHPYNITGLCTRQLCYSKTRCSAALWFHCQRVGLRLKTSTDKRRRKRRTQNIGQAGGVELGSDASCGGSKGGSGGLRGSAGYDTEEGRAGLSLTNNMTTACVFYFTHPSAILCVKYVKVTGGVWSSPWSIRCLFVSQFESCWFN